LPFPAINPSFSLANIRTSLPSRQTSQWLGAGIITK
jgi:hypothetical protein